MTKVRESYVKRLRDNYLLIVRTLMHDLIVSIDAQGNFVFVNDAAVAFFGEKKEILLGSHFSRYIHPEDIDKTISVLQDLINQSNQVMGFIIRTKSPKGYRTVAWNGLAIFDDDGNYVGAQATGKDLSELLKTKEELAQSQSHLRSLFKVIVDPLVIVDLTGNIMELSQSAEKIFEKSRDDLIGKNFLKTKVATSTSKKVMRENLSRMEKGLYIPPYGIDFTSKDGKLFSYEVNPTRIVYNGQPAILAIFRNITEQKNVEKKLLESEKRFKYFLDNAPDPIWVQDLFGTFIDGNKMVEELTGYSRQELLGKNLLNILVPPEQISHVVDSFKIDSTGTVIGPVDLELQKKDGRLVSVEGTIIPIERNGKIEIVGISRDITERKQSEKALKESEEKIRAVMSSAKDAIILMNPEGKVSYWNDAAEKMFGYSREEIIGNEIHNFLGPKRFHGNFSEEFRKFKKTGKSFPVDQTIEMPAVKKDGTEFPVEISVSAFKMNQKWHAVSIVRDITERKQVENALRREREILDTVTGNINAGLVVVSKDYTILWANEVLTKYLGDIVGKPCFSTLNQSDNVCQGCGVQEVFETGNDWVVHEQLVSTPTRDNIWLEITSTAIRNEKGEIVAASEMSWDVTERKKIELKLKESLQKFQTIFEGATEGIVGIDPKNQKFVFVNPHMTEMTGYSNDEFLQTGLFTLLPKENVSYAEDMYKQMLTQQKSFVPKIPLVTKDKNVIFVDVSSRLMKIGDNKYFVGFVRDVTEQKNAEDAITEKNQLLKRSNQELENYTYVVSHDLKAPLRTIRSFASFLLEDYHDKLDEQGKDYLDRMVKASSHLNQMIEDLLILSRVGRKFTEFEKVNLNKLLEEILLDLESTINETKTKIVVSKLPKIEAQRVWMKQLFMNLLSNALKFNESKTPKIEITYEKKGTQHLFSIKDNGIGIAKKYQKTIFKLFERAPTDKKYEGTGAGLAICSKIVDALGGKIWVESTLGKGSSFFFTLPIKLKSSKKAV